jgi:hypothetical protein
MQKLEVRMQNENHSVFGSGLILHSDFYILHF